MRITRDRRWFWGGIACLVFVAFDVLSGNAWWAVVPAACAFYLLLD